MNFLLDTNVISEIKRKRGDSRVKDWARRQESVSLFTSVMVIGEIRRGVELMRRRDPSQTAGFEAWLAQLRMEFSSRVLPVTEEIAEEWGRLNVPDPSPTVDALMIATARVHDMAIVSRNIRDVGRGGAPVLNPWQEG